MEEVDIKVVEIINHFPLMFKPVIPVEVQTTLPDILTVVVKDVDVETEVVVIQ